MMTDNKNNVDKNSFAFIYNEEIYIVPEGKVSASPLKEEKPAVKETPVIEKKVESEKKTPVIPKNEIKPAVAIKDYAIIVRTKEELDVEKDLLGKILGAIKLDLNKVDLCTSETEGESILKKSEHPYIIAFGMDTSKFQQTMYKVGKKGSTTLLFSHSLSELQKDVEKKKALWAALKNFL